MKAMILAAGRGERLQPLTSHTPKPMIPVGGKPLIAHQLSWLKNANITEIVINLHHLGEKIETFCGDGSRFGVNIRYSREARLLDTAGGIANALPLLGEHPFVLLNGDVFTDFPFASLPERPPQWADVHLVLTPTPGYRSDGDFELADDRVIARGSTFVYCGIAVIDPRWIQALVDASPGAEPTPLSLQQPLFRAVAAGRVSAQRWDGVWIDIGSPAQLRFINEQLGTR